MRTFVLINQKKLKEPKPRKCKNPDCKNTFVPTFSTTQKCCQISCAVELAEIIEREKERKRGSEIIAKMKIDTHSKEFKKALQNEINKLSRMIDARFKYVTCIDCGKTFGKQIDAAHFHGRGANSTLRYNLHNLHSAKSDCNQYSDTHKQGYEKGLEERYNKIYAEYVIEKLPLLYKEIHLSNVEVHEKLKLVRSIVRNFDTYKFDNAISARNTLNNLIGIYKTNF